MKNTVIKKAAAILLILCGLLAAMLVLTHPAQNGRRTTEILPEINGEPVYVECEAGVPVEASLCAKEEFTAGGVWVLLVNISEESRGTVRFAVTDGASNLLLNQVIPVESISPGKWFLVEANIAFAKGETYQLSILADGSEPYFMQVPEGGAESLPFTMAVEKGGEPVDCGISLGVNVAEEVAVTYGEILYYSIPVCILAALFGIICVAFGFRRVRECVGRVPFGKFFARYGNDLFLILLFSAVCLSIYSRACLKGVYISADSAGYLREAVNLTAGNGFHYDGMAGYDSWFANWPILYPAFIALMMAVTGADAYLASKLLTMVIIGILLVVIRLYFKKDAWVYALCLTNIGFLNLSYYTWSEIPFMVFLLGFALTLAGIVEEEEPGGRRYFVLGLLGLCCFLTRYFGIYVWIATGAYILYFFIGALKKKEKRAFKKPVMLTVTAFVSGSLSMAYLLLNKIMNGMASGVSRTLWWDDNEKLTNDMIESLLTEVFNVFSLQIPELIEGFPYQLKVFVVATVIAGLVWFTWKNCRPFSRESVMIFMGVSYYLIFIVIRYFSSMDTFYFRFFEPASFLLCFAFIGLLLPYLRGKRGFHFFGGAVSILVILAAWSLFENGGMDTSDSYYAQLAGQWDKAYEEIPERSVIIFNDIDFRSSYYRPDVVEGTISPADSLEDLRTVYYGSEYLCIRREFAEVMLRDGEYEESVAALLKEGMAENTGGEFLVVPLSGSR